MQRRGLRRGFTLIELLVVLVILSVVISLAVVWVRPMSDARRLALTAQQCQRVLLAAQQQAMLTPAVLGLEVTPQGLKFYRYVVEHDRLVWRPLKSDGLSQPTLFKQQGVLATRMPRQPHWLVISASGDVTPFQLQLSNTAGTFGYRITVNAAGAISSAPWSKVAS